jgi:hypothetical protein
VDKKEKCTLENRTTKILSMKRVFILMLLLSTSAFVKAQNVTELSPGRYESKIKNAQKSWDKGDVIILDDSRYKLSGDSEIGEFMFSVAAQRIFFTSGPLKSAFTKVKLNNNKPAIIFPMEQNKELGLPAEVWASKQ